MCDCLRYFSLISTVHAFSTNPSLQSMHAGRHCDRERGRASVEMGDIVAVGVGCSWYRSDGVYCIG